MPAGRPTKYRPEYCQIAEDTLSEGLSQAVLAGKLNVDEDTITNWKAEHEEFFGAIKRGSSKGRELWERMGIQGASGQIDGFNATSWIFNMKNRFGWRDRQEVFGEGGGALVVQIVKHGDE